MNQSKQVTLCQLIRILSRIMQIKNNSQRKLLRDFFQAEGQRKQKEEALNRAKAEVNEAITVYHKLESNLSDFTRPKHQLNINDDSIERLRDMKEFLLEEAQTNILNSADTYASTAKQLGIEILQRIEDYRQAKSDSSSLIQKMRSEWQSLNNRKSVKYIKSELSTLQNQYNSAEQHFEADTASDYHQALKISREISSKINELTPLADKRKSKRDDKIIAGIIGAVSGFMSGLFVGCPFACMAASTHNDTVANIVALVFGITGAIIGLCAGFFGSGTD